MSTPDAFAGAARVIEDVDCRECGKDSCPGDCTPDSSPPELEPIEDGGGEPDLEAFRSGPGASWLPQDLTAILSGEETEDPPSILRMDCDEASCLLYKGRKNLIVALYESFKTWVALWACAQVVAAGEKGIYIDYEDSARGVIPRALALGIPPKKIRERFFYVQPEDSAEHGWPVLRLLIETHRPGLVVLDGVTEAMALEGLDLSNNPDVAEFYNRLPTQIARLGPAVLMLDHPIKSHEGRGNWPIGGQHKLSGLDGAAYNLTATAPFGRGRTGRGRLTLVKDRLGFVPSEGRDRRVADVELVSNGETVSVRLTPATAPEDFRPTCIMERVSRALENSGEGISVNQIKKEVTGKATFQQCAIETLAAEGFIASAPGPRNAALYRSIKPYREADE